jgi:hypothetical protein
MEVRLDLTMPTCSHGLGVLAGDMPWAAADLTVPTPGSETHARAPIDDQVYLGEILNSSARGKDKA